MVMVYLLSYCNAPVSAPRLRGGDQRVQILDQYPLRSVKGDHSGLAEPGERAAYRLDRQ
jgi:hypothetical protein